METLGAMERRCLNQLLRRFTPETADCMAELSLGLELYIKALKTGAGTEEDVLTNSQIIAISQVLKT